MSIAALGLFLLSAGLPMSGTPPTMPAHVAMTPMYASATAQAYTTCTHRVVFGDTLSRLAPTTWRVVAANNGIRDPNLIYVNQTINLCLTGAATSAPAGKTYSTFQPSIAPTAKGANTYPWGWCTWGAAQLALDNVNGLGDARNWFVNATRRGMATGYTPRAGSTAVFTPGYHVSNFGTSSGHVAHVDAVAGNLMQITEMNNSFYAGFGRYDTVWVQIVPGMVQFIY